MERLEISILDINKKSQLILEKEKKELINRANLIASVSNAEIISAIEDHKQKLVVRIGNPCAYFRSISPIAQVKKPRRSTTTSAFFDLHSRKNILRNMHKDFQYGLLVRVHGICYAPDFVNKSSFGSINPPVPK